MPNTRKEQLKLILRKRFPTPPDFLKRAGFTSDYTKRILAFESFKDEKDKEEYFWYRTILAYMYFLKGKFMQAAQILENLLRFVQESDIEKIKLLKFNLAMVYFQWSAEIRNKRTMSKVKGEAKLERNTKKSAEDAFKEVLELTKDDDSQFRTRALIAYGFFMLWKREEKESISIFDKALLLAKRKRLKWEEAVCYDGRALICKLNNDFVSALTYLSRIFEIHKREGNEGKKLEVQHNIALTLWDKEHKNPDDVLEKLLAFFHYLMEYGDYKVAAGICKNIAQVYGESGNTEKAKEYINKAIEITRNFEIG